MWTYGLLPSHPLLQARRGVAASGEFSDEKFIAPLAVPKLPPQRMYFLFQEPIVTDPADTKVIVFVFLERAVCIFRVCMHFLFQEPNLTDPSDTKAGVCLFL